MSALDEFGASVGECKSEPASHLVFFWEVMRIHLEIQILCELQFYVCGEAQLFRQSLTEFS